MVMNTMMMILSLFNEDANEEKLLSRRLEGAGSTLQSILRKRTSSREHFIIILRLRMVRMMLYHHGEDGDGDDIWSHIWLRIICLSWVRFPQMRFVIFVLYFVWSQSCICIFCSPKIRFPRMLWDLIVGEWGSLIDHSLLPDTAHDRRAPLSPGVSGNHFWTFGNRTGSAHYHILGTGTGMA